MTLMLPAWAVWAFFFGLAQLFCIVIIFSRSLIVRTYAAGMLILVLAVWWYWAPR